MPFSSRVSIRLAALCRKISFSSEIKPGIEAAKKNRQQEHHRTGKLKIDDLFHVMRNEGTRVSHNRVMPRPQPELKMGERTIPVKNLNQNSKEKTRKVNPPDCLVSGPPQRTKKQKDDPEEMDQNNQICKNLIQHLSLKS